MTRLLDHKEMTAHLRDRIKESGIKAGVRMVTYCGCRVISVYPRGGVDAMFTVEEQITIAHIARVNGLTLSMGLPIEDHGAHGPGFRFHLGYESSGAGE